MKLVTLCALVAIALAGCVRDDGMREAWKGVSCVQKGTC